MYVGCFSDGAFSDTSTFSTSHPPVFLHAGETHFRFRVSRHVQFHPALARLYLSSYGPCSVFDLFYPTHLQFTNENTVHKARILQKSRNYKGTTKKQSSRDQSVWGPLQRVQRSAIVYISATSRTQQFFYHISRALAVLLKSPLEVSSKVVTIVGGHGQIALRLAKLLSPTHKVTSIIRTPAHIPDIEKVNSTPLLLSLETHPVSKFTEAFNNTDVVVFAAGAVKVFDAIEGVEAKEKPRLVLVSSIDLRSDPDKFPDYYMSTKEDIENSKKFRTSINEYFKLKYEADKNLAHRDSFNWTIVHPGSLTNEPGTGKGVIGRTSLKTVTRDDVAFLLALLIDKPKAAGLAVEFINGDTPIEQALDAAIKSEKFTGWKE
ncbi:hypothetical protein ABKN59_009061 [Abortiporus biennis]